MFSFPIKEVKKLQQKKYRDEHNVYVVEGEKGVREAIEEKQKIVSLYGTH